MRCCGRIGLLGSRIPAIAVRKVKGEHNQPGTLRMCGDSTRPQTRDESWLHLGELSSQRRVISNRFEEEGIHSMMAMDQTFAVSGARDFE
jgi:hypothetical protein